MLLLSEDEVSDDDDDDYGYSSDFDEDSPSKATAQRAAKVSSRFADYHDASFESESAESYNSASSSNHNAAEERHAASEEKRDSVSAGNKNKHHHSGQQNRDSNSSSRYSNPSLPQQAHRNPSTIPTTSSTEEDRRTLAEVAATTAYGLRDRERVMNPMRESLAHSLLASQVSLS